MIITAYNEIIPEGFVKGQKKVFDKFGEKIIQIKGPKYPHFHHPRVLDNYIKYDIIDKNIDWDHLIVVDIDCIPLNKNVIKDAREWVRNNLGLYSIAQNANHISDGIGSKPGVDKNLDYAAPSFIAFSRKTYEELNYPSFEYFHGEAPRWDVGGEFTQRAMDKNLPIKLMYPSHVEKPLWKFADGSMFGIGTTYDNKIYHHFEARDNQVTNFINKVNQIL